jgi:hypothetical protein
MENTKLGPHFKMLNINNIDEICQGIPVRQVKNPAELCFLGKQFNLETGFQSILRKHK